MAGGGARALGALGALRALRSLRALREPGSARPGGVARGRAEQAAGAHFDLEAKAAHRARAVRLGGMGEPEPLQAEVVGRLLGRLEDCRRARGVVAVVGGALEAAARGLATRPEIDRVIYCDTGREPLLAARAAHAAALPSDGGGPACDFVQYDEGTLLAGLSELGPGEEGWLDAVVCPLSLHWANDVPGLMVQCREALKPDGLFLAALFGEGTLEEMRIACAAAEMEREGGASARTSPMVRVRDAGNLLGRAGLSLPVVDVDSLAVNYPDAFAAVDHLRRMGEQNANVRRRRALPRDTALAAGVAYQYLFGPGGEEARGGAGAEGLGDAVQGTFEVVFMGGWRPDRLQQTPAKRGSATVSLADLGRDLEGKGEG